VSEDALNHITQIIRNRRSLKPKAMDPGCEVNEVLLKTLLENATWAPTHGMTEPWFFSIYRGESRGRLAAQLQSLYQKLTDPAEFREDKFVKLGTNPLLAPVVIAIGMRRQPISKIPETEEIEAVACAVQNMYLTASATGLGAFWSSPPILYQKEANPFFGLGEDDRCLGLLYLGWPREGTDRPVSQRRPLDEKCQFFDT